MRSPPQKRQSGGNLHRLPNRKSSKPRTEILQSPRLRQKNIFRQQERSLYYASSPESPPHWRLEYLSRTPLRKARAHDNQQERRILSGASPSFETSVGQDANLQGVGMRTKIEIG